VVFLKLWIGSFDPALSKTLEQYFLKRGFLRTHSEHHYLIEFPHESLPAVSHHLAAILVEGLLPKILISSVRKLAPNLSVEEQKTVLNHTVNALGNSGDLKLMCKEFSDLIFRHFSENMLLNAEGLLFFQGKPLLNASQKYLREMLDRYEQQRLISILRQYAGSKPSTLPYLKIHPSENDYFLFDEFSRRIIMVFREDYTPEEKLINSLLLLSPAKIDLRELCDADLKILLEEIFAEKIVK